MLDDYANGELSAIGNHEYAALMRDAAKAIRILGALVELRREKRVAVMNDYYMRRDALWSAAERLYPETVNYGERHVQSL